MWKGVRDFVVCQGICSEKSIINDGLHKDEPFFGTEWPNVAMGDRDIGASFDFLGLWTIEVWYAVARGWSGTILV